MVGIRCTDLCGSSPQEVDVLSGSSARVIISAGRNVSRTHTVEMRTDDEGGPGIVGTALSADDVGGLATSWKCKWVGRDHQAVPFKGLRDVGAREQIAIGSGLPGIDEPSA